MEESPGLGESGATMLKSYYVAYDGSESAMAALHYACHFAALAQGKVYVGHVIELPADPAIATGMMAGSMEFMAAVPPSLTTQEIEQVRADREAQAGDLLERARKLCEAWPVACETVCSTGYREEEIQSQAQQVDVLLMGRQGIDRTADSGKIGHLTEALIRSAPQPVLVASRTFYRPEELVVLYDGRERAQHALSLAVELARMTSLPLIVVTACTEREECERIMQGADQFLRDHEVVYRHEEACGEHQPEENLLPVLAGHSTAMIVMGAFGESRVKEWIIGSTTRKILTHTAHPVLLTNR